MKEKNLKLSQIFWHISSPLTWKLKVKPNAEVEDRCFFYLSDWRQVNNTACFSLPEHNRDNISI